MSVLGRLLISSAERIDLSDLLSVDSYAAGDFKFLLKGLVGDARPYVLKGFDIIDPQTAIGTQSCSVRVAESVVFYPGSSAGPFFHGLPEGHPEAQPLVPELRKNAVNFVYLTFSTFNTSTDTRAFWDPDKDGGVGGEFTQDVNTESVLRCEINVSVGSFPSNTIPIAKVTVGPVVITAIEDARDMMFRLGTGGISPDPYSQYNFRSLPSTLYERAEPPTKMLAGGDNPFQGADKNIYSLKEWMDVVMTKLKELGGTTYWYQDAATFSLIASFVDAIATSFKSKGQWQHSSATPGLVTWTEDIQLKIATDPRTYILRAGNATATDEQVAYIPMVRNQPFNSGDQIVAWTSGANYVNTVGGAVGLFADLSKGDWVKAINDPNHMYLRVEEFYDSINLGGSTTTAAFAKSIRLGASYAGPTLNDKGRYDQGIYDASEVVVSSRDQAAITSTGGNFNWLFLRSDTIQNISSIITTSLTIDISNHDGSKAKVVSSGAHGLVDGDRVTISGSTNFDGTYEVEVESSTIFYILKSSAAFADELARTARYATVTTSVRSTAYGLQLESANHGFQSDDTVTLSSTTNYNGSFLINKTGATTFTIPVSSAATSETAGLGTLARVTVRAEQGVFNLVQGESGNIGDNVTSNMKLFLGMTSDSQQYPDYHIPESYNTLDGSQNYNSASSDNVTDRLSKLTAMMADKAQDKNLKFLSQGLNVVQNTTNGAAQELTFLPTGATLTILQTGGQGHATITLPDVAPGISLLANQVAYVSIDRNAASAPTIQVANATNNLLIDENIVVIASRLTGADAWLWDGTPLSAGANPSPVLGDAQDRNTKLIEGGVWAWNAGTGMLSFTAAAYLQVPGQTDVRNTILAAVSPINLPLDGSTAYVTLVRTPGAATNLVVNVADIASVPNTANTLIIARRIGTDVMVGNGTVLLIDGESQELESGLSVQNRALFGTSVTEATSNPGYAARGAVNRITSDSEGSLDAIARHDAEFDKGFGQFRMIAKTAGNKKRVRVTGSDRIMFTGETITQEMSSLRVSFTGAEIDFNTGSIFGGDATLPLSTDFVTPLGVNFIPATIPANEYLWYSIAVNPAGSNPDNTLNAQFNVLPGATAGTTPTLASKPALGGLKKLGFVVVKDNGSGGSGTVLNFDDIGFTLPAASAQAKVAQLGVGSGGGGGSGLQKVRLHNPTSTTLPTGVVTVDNVSVIPDDLVLFSNLSGGTLTFAQSLTSDGTSFTNVNTAFRAQSFTSLLSNTVTSVTLSLQKTGSPSGSLTVELRSDSAGTPGALLATSSSLSISTLNPSFSLPVTFSFTGVPLTSSTVYWIVLNDSGVTFSGGQYGIDIDGTNPYAGGVVSHSTDSGSTWTPSVGSDYYFKIEGSAGSGDNKIYKAIGTIGNITSWQSQYVFDGSDSPGDGDTVIIKEGASFADTIGEFDGTEWRFNNKVRYFNGADYWEISNLNSAAIADNQVAPADIFAINYAGSENLIIDYSISRGTTKETGTVTMTTDGTTVGIATTNVDLAASAGVTFSALISGAQIKLQYISTSTGSAGQIKWVLRRWSDSAGGPGGIPSYSGGGGSSITGGGSTQQIAIWTTPTNVSGNSNFTIDTATGVLKLGSGSNIVENSILQSAAIASGVQSDTLLFTYNTSYNFAIIEYSLVKGAGNYRIGTLLITQDAAANINVADVFSEIGTSEVAFASPGVVHTINGSLVEIRYDSSGGVGGTFKYAMRRWA